jgi:putative ABC transport system permease protein
MNWNDIVRARISGTIAPPDPDVVEELAQHASAAYEAARADGLDQDTARAHVEILVDGWFRDPKWMSRRPRRRPIVHPPPAATSGWTGLGQDLRYGLRLLRQRPGFAAVAILTTALGIGAATSLFSLAYGVLLRPLPWPESDRLVRPVESREGATRRPGPIISNATYLAWRENPATLDGIAGYDDRAMTLSAPGAVERIRVVAATASLFDVLATRPVLGAPFGLDDELPGRDHVVVLSHALWASRFNRDPGVIGQSLELDGDSYRVVALMPEGFFFPDPEALAWIPRRVPPVIGADPNSRTASLFGGIARLKPGVSPSEAASEGTARGLSAPSLGNVGIAVFGVNAPPSIAVVPYAEAITADARPALVLLLAAVGLLLAATFANVAGLQLARTAARRREVALRAALGAGLGRLARQLFTENAMLAAAAGLTGLVAAFWLNRLIPAVAPSDFPRLEAVRIDWRAAVFAICASGVATVAFGLLPMLLARRLNLIEALNEDSLAPVGGGVRSPVSRMRSMLMAGQIGAAALLLVGAALLGRSFLALLHVDRGYDPTNLVTAELPMPERAYTGPTRAARLGEVLTRLAGVAGVTHVAVSDSLPLRSGGSMMMFTMPDSATAITPGSAVQASLRMVTTDYFATLGRPIVDGRGFASTDTVTSEPVAVVNRAFVRRYVNGPPLGVGLPLDFGRGDAPWRIVGIVGDIVEGATDAPVQPEVFVGAGQLRDGIATETPIVLARTAGDPAALVPTLRTIVREVDPAIPLQRTMTMEERLVTSLARPRLYALLVGVFAVFVLLVSGIGLFGVLSYSVAQRAREIGVRTALGARPWDIAALVVRQGLAVTLSGISVGLLVALAGARRLASLLYGVTSSDPVSYAAVAVVLLTVAGVACYLPARRAARVDPLQVLKGH